MKANGKPPRLRQLRLLREILFMTQPRLLAVMLERYPQVVRWTRASRTTCGKGEVPSLAKEGWPRHQVNGPIPLEARPGWFVQLPIIGGLNQPPCLRPLRRLRGIFLMGAATPPCARRGGRAIQKISRSIRLSRGRGGFPMNRKRKPPRLRLLRWLRQIFFDDAATPPLPRRRVCASYRFVLNSSTSGALTSLFAVGCRPPTGSWHERSRDIYFLMCFSSICRRTTAP